MILTGSNPGPGLREFNCTSLIMRRFRDPWNNKSNMKRYQCDIISYPQNNSSSLSSGKSIANSADGLGLFDFNQPYKTTSRYEITLSGLLHYRITFSETVPSLQTVLCNNDNSE